MFNFTLEKYDGINSRYSCPNCNARREFSRYIDASGNYLAETVGKCNRDSKCGYHFTPKMYFAENPNHRNFSKGYPKKRNGSTYLTGNRKQSETDYTDIDRLKKRNSIPFVTFAATLKNYENNCFVQFLCELFRDDIEAVQSVLERYFIGTWKDCLTVFWQIDQRGKIRTGKIMRYDIQTGKRQTVRTWIQDGETCELKTDWMHRELIKQKALKADFELKQCFFGEHLLRKEPDKPIAIVEAEKTALICSICFPEMLWLAIGAKGYLTLKRFQVLRGRKIVLFPDADAYSDWKEKALEAQRNGFNVRISSLIETKSTETEKKKGFDVADYLIREQKQINQYNDFVDVFNTKLQNVLNCEILIEEFATILEERTAIMIFDGGLSETEAVKLAREDVTKTWFDLFRE